MDGGLDPGLRDPARIPRFCVIPSNGRECLDLALEAMLPQVDRILVTWTGDWENRRQLPHPDDNRITYRIDRDAAPNISRWWNIGLDAAAMFHRHDFPGTPRWDVAIINDDVIVPPGWFDAVATKMREMSCAAACAGGSLPMPALYTNVGPVTGISNPLEGFAFMVAGELGLRANEDIPWYFSDNYMDWESRKLGGTLVIPGFNVQHLYPNGQMTNDFLILNAQGIQTFVDLYDGLRPW